MGLALQVRGSPCADIVADPPPGWDSTNGAGLPLLDVSVSLVIAGDTGRSNSRPSYAVEPVALDGLDDLGLSRTDGRVLAVALAVPVSQLSVGSPSFETSTECNIGSATGGVIVASRSPRPSVPTIGSSRLCGTSKTYFARARKNVAPRSGPKQAQRTGQSA